MAVYEKIVAYYLSLQPYFYSYLQVARNTGSVAAGRITLVYHPSPNLFVPYFQKLILVHDDRYSHSPRLSPPS